MILLIGVLALFSCENELDINMDIDGVPVIYCVLDMDDTSQVVRLAKSFLCPGMNLLRYIWKSGGIPTAP